MPPSSHAPEDEGFEALLRPIQDLTRNWDVDLSLHLEEYINYIRQVCGDENVPCMNFAQAGILVQNSACIYSRKVDFIYITVVQFNESINKKKNESRDSGNLEDDGGTGQPIKKRKALASLETDEFITFDDVCTERAITINVAKEQQKAKERKKPNIVLNAAIKVKAKEKTTCNVFNHSQDIMGKKDEFRLNWRICSAGTLHEEFVIKKNIFQTQEPVEEPVFENDNAPVDDSNGNLDLDYTHINGHPVEDPPQDNDSPVIPPHSSESRQDQTQRESVLNPDAHQRLKRNENLADANHAAWQPLDFNQNIAEKPIIKKKRTKLPPKLSTENKRKLKDIQCPTFTVADFTMSEFKNRGYLRDEDFAQLSTWVFKSRNMLMADLHADYQAFLARIDDPEQDFLGFDNGSDSDGDDNANDDNPFEIDIPLPDKENILDPCENDGWQGDGLNTYEYDVRKTMQAYRLKKDDDSKKTDLAKRVEEWHHRITPKLEAAEQRSGFDINEYGTKVLNSFTEGIGSVKPFQEIVAGQPREEVARYFLASLVLANQYNVEISESEPGDLNVDCVQLKLLSTVRHHEELDDNMRQTSNEH